MPFDDESARWLADLEAGGYDAHRRLHGLLLRAARAEVSRRARLTGVEADDVAHQAAADAMLAVLAKLPRFRGESRFTTWAYRFVVLEVSAKLGRHFWIRHPDLPLDLAPEPAQPVTQPMTQPVNPELAAQGRHLVAVLRDAVEHDLTERQRRVFRAVVLDGTPPDGLAIGRNAVYKILFDARRRLRTRLAAEGLTEDCSGR